MGLLDTSDARAGGLPFFGNFAWHWVSCLFTPAVGSLWSDAPHLTTGPLHTREATTALRPKELSRGFAPQGAVDRSLTHLEAFDSFSFVNRR